MKTIHNERLKITATFLNGLAIAIFAIGGLAPAVQAIRAMRLPPELLNGTILLVVICTGVAGILHSGARRLLGGLVE
jgi:uncharacterized membrane protein YfcA